MKSGFKSLNRQPLLEMLTAGELDDIHYASLEILEDVGIDVYSGEARELLKNSGAHVNGINVKIPSFLIEDAIRSAPPRVVMHDRLGNRAMALERSSAFFGTGSDLIYTIDLTTGQRRFSTIEDVGVAAKLTDALCNIDFAMSYAMPQGDKDGVELLQLRQILANTVKPFIMTVFSDKQVLKKMIDMCRIVAGGREELEQKPFLCVYGQFISPLTHHEEGLDRLLICSENMVPIIYIPTILAGASGPATMAGAVALGNAEVLAGLTIGQLKRRGSPFIFGGCVSAFDMSKMVLPYGSPEWQMANGVMCQLARRYRLPVFATGGCTDAKTFDAQAAAEGAFSLLTAALTGGNLIHDVGYMQGGLAGSPAYLAFCDEMIGYVKRVLRNFDVTDDTIALEQVRSVGPHGDFLTEEHTVTNYKNETWYPGLFDRNSYEEWEKSGAKTAEQKSVEKAAFLLANHTPIPLDPKISELLDGFIND